MSLTRAGHAAVAFYVTADAGRTWSIASIRLVASAVSRSHSPFVAYVPTGIVSATTWWVAGVGARARIAVTTDAGKTWNAVTPTGLPSLRAPTISAVDDRHAWLINLADGRLAAYSTTDAGRRWRRLSLPEN